MSEATIQSGIQTALRAMTEFDDADVVINDWGILDQSVQRAPYVLIENADTFRSRQDTMTPNTTWEVPVTLIEAFSDWDTSLNNLRSRRQAIIDKINSDSVRSAGGLTAITIDEVRSDGPINRIYPAAMIDEINAETLPLFLSQRIILVAEEF